jgi:hypothetical protein
MSESHDPEGDAPRTPIIEHVPEPQPAPEPELRAPEPLNGSATPPAAVPAPRRGGTPLAFTLLLALALGGGIYWTWTHPQGAPHDDPQAAIDAAKSELSDKLQALGSRIDALEKQAGAAADAGKRLDEIAAQQTQLAASVQKLQELASQKPAAEPAQGPAQAAAPPPPQVSAPTGAGDAQQTAELSSRLDQTLAQEKASFDALDQRLAKLEQNTSAATEAQDNRQTIETLASRVQKLE